ncbi:hypothetical protein [Longispora albida]|uniref:hypothetical protein n=1 Tax=Longispora albida TaxID=203523 RepID=UPI00037428AA|nr:hypothetical protein [Longispora albida]
MRWGHDIHTFRYAGWQADPETGEVRLGYELVGDSGTVSFTERIEFGPFTPSETFRRVIDLLHLAAGTSYYKLAAPRRVVSETPVPAEVAAYVRELYTNGLAEFAYNNDLPHVFDLDFVFDASAQHAAPVTIGERPLVAVGGGKDSLVSLEAFRRGGLNPVGFAVSPNWIITDVLATSGLDTLTVRRRIDQSILKLNEQGALNGHIPVTAINSLIGVAASVLGGHGPMVMSNERSASAPNLVWHGREVNHQWSKGVDAERGLRTALEAHAGITDGYFSFLRPFSELHIARMFATFDTYDHVVTSCNKAFRLSGATSRWCGDCPKCRFVFLAMAPFMPRERIVGIFGADLLSDAQQIPGYLELLGIDGHKPFECVGEVEESAVALDLLRKSAEWQDAPVVKALADAVPFWPSGEDEFVPSADHFVPPQYRRLLDALA